MAASHIRIGGLRLRAGHRDAVLPFRNDLEDALCTASLPFGRSALIRIRRIALGRLPARLTRQTLSRLVAGHLARVTPVPARLGEPLPPTADALIFTDMVEAAAFALDAALAGTPVHWALQSSFPSLDREEPETRIIGILETLITSSGAAAPGRMAFSEFGLARLLAALESLPIRAHRALLKAMACKAPEIDRMLTAAAPDDGLMSHPSSSGPTEERMAAPILAIDAFEHAPPLLRRALEKASRRYGWRHPLLVTLTAFIARSLAGLPGQDAALVKLAKARTSSPRTWGDGEVPAASSSPASEPPESDLEVLSDPEPATKTSPLPPSCDAVPSNPATSRKKLPPSTIALGEATDFAGFWLLLAALRHAGAEALEQAFGLPLAQTALQRLAKRLHLDETHPGMEALGPDWRFWEDALPPARSPAPPNLKLLPMIAGRRGVWIAREGRGHALMGVAPRWPSAVLDESALRHVREVCPVVRERLVRPPLASGLINGLLLSTRRLLRLTSGQSWRRITAIPGHVTLTATHLDVTFDARNLDIGVRLAGLDIDPGWVPWLGRVVSFHYDYSKVRDHIRSHGGGRS